MDGVNISSSNNGQIRRSRRDYNLPLEKKSKMEEYQKKKKRKKEEEEERERDERGCRGSGGGYGMR